MKAALAPIEALLAAGHLARVAAVRLMRRTH
ncbi:hypothetical protein [Bradyrhizobium sp. JR4.1]